jgi:hypothetical protein
MPKCRRKVKRSIARWVEDAENDLPELEMKILSQKTNNKEEWTSAVKKAKVFGRMYSQGVNK